MMAMSLDTIHVVHLNLFLDSSFLSAPSWQHLALNMAEYADLKPQRHPVHDCLTIG